MAEREELSIEQKALIFDRLVAMFAGKAICVSARSIMVPLDENRDAFEKRIVRTYEWNLRANDCDDIETALRSMLGKTKKHDG